MDTDTCGADSDASLSERMQGASVPSKTAIQAEQLKKSYKLYDSPVDAISDRVWRNLFRRQRKTIASSEKTALKGIDFEVKKGSKLAVIGSNGSGKTTLLKLLAGLTNSSSGRLVVDGNVRGLFSTGIGFRDELPGIDNIRTSLVLQGFADSEVSDALDDILDFVELGEFIYQPISAYSSGMRARLEFAVATVIKPDILLIDEVLGAGDGYFRQKCAMRIRSLLGGECTLIMVSHAGADIQEYCDDALWLENGEIREHSDVKSVWMAYEKYQTERREANAVASPMQPVPEVEEEISEADGFERARKTSAELLSSYLLSAPRAEGRPHIDNVVFEGTEDEKRTVCETGGEFQLRLRFTQKSADRNEMRAFIFGFDSAGRPFWSANSSLPSTKAMETSATSESTIKLGPLTAGPGLYHLTVAIGEVRDGQVTLWDAHHTTLVVKVPITNVASPPLVYCSGKFHVEGHNSSPARVSGWM